MRTGLFTTRNFNAMMAAMAFAVAALPAASHAFTEEDQRRLCMGDVFKLCASEIPDRGKITDCMRRQRASLSEGCRSVFGKATEQSESVSTAAATK